MPDFKGRYLAQVNVKVVKSDITLAFMFTVAFVAVLLQKWLDLNEGRFCVGRNSVERTHIHQEDNEKDEQSVDLRDVAQG